MGGNPVKGHLSYSTSSPLIRPSFSSQTGSFQAQLGAWR